MKINFLSVMSLIILTSKSIFAQAIAEAPAVVTAEQPPAWMQMVPILAVVVVFYFFMIRPQAKKHKEQSQFLNSLKTGDLIITSAGLLGKITGLNDQIANLEIASGVQIKILKSQISTSQAILQKSEAAQMAKTAPQAK